MKKLKKFLAATLAAATTLSSFFAFSVSANAVESGSYDSTDFTITDATQVQKHVAKIIKLNDEKIKLYDIDNDGILTVNDATCIQKIIAKISIDSVSENGISTANLQNGGILTGDENYIYYAYEKSVYRLNSDNSGKVKLATESGNIKNLNLYGNYLCYLSATDDETWCYGSDSGTLTVYNLLTGEKWTTGNALQNYPIVYNGTLYYIQKNGNQLNGKSGDWYSLSNLYSMDLESKKSTLITQNVYTLGLNEDKLIYGKLEDILEVAVGVTLLRYFDFETNAEISASGRMAPLASNYNEYPSCNYTLTSENNITYTYETKRGSYVRTDSNGNSVTLSALNEYNFYNGYSPLRTGELNYIYKDTDIVFYVNDNGEIIKGNYSTGKETVLMSKTYSKISRLQMYNDKLYAVVDGVLTEIAAK